MKVSKAPESLRNVVEEIKAAIAGKQAMDITVHLPGIPYLARGAAVPPNREFLTILSENPKNGKKDTVTVEEAVALVMADYEKSNLAGQNAILSVLQDILGTVSGIELGDSVLGQAVERYNRKMAVVKGGR